jgi:hypothetical protein
MLSLTQIVKLAGAAILIALAAATIPALAPLGPQERILFDMSRQIGECQTARTSDISPRLPSSSRARCAYRSPPRTGESHNGT